MTTAEIELTATQEEYKRHYLALLRSKETILFSDLYLNSFKPVNDEEKARVIEQTKANKEAAERDVIFHQAHVDAMIALMKK